MSLNDLWWHVTQLIYETVILAVLMLAVKGIELLAELLSHGSEEFAVFTYVHYGTAILISIILGFRVVLRFARAPIYE